MKSLKQYFILISILFVLSFGFSSINNTTVYVCKGKSATKYHYKKDCRGLSNCKAEIEAVTLSQAQEDERTLCGWED